MKRLLKPALTTLPLVAWAGAVDETGELTDDTTIDGSFTGYGVTFSCSSAEP